MDCFICVEKKSFLVNCAKCLNSSCKNCFQEYLLNSTLTPVCMHCREPLSDDFIIDNTSLSWRINRYKSYKEQTLYDSERSRLPETQIYAQAYKNAKTVMAPVFTEIFNLKPVLKQSRLMIAAIDYYRMMGEGTNKYYTSILEKENPNFRTLNLDDLKRKQVMLRAKSKRRLYELNQISYLYSPIIASHGKSIDRTEKDVTHKKIVTKACPATGCSAFLNEDFSCGICKSDVCKKCHEIKIEGHECNEDTVASIKAVSAEAKTCPSCATLISKIDGCDQMWCTQCKTSFSWRTGLIETGITHNPHYYEWMRNNGGMPRAPGDNPRGCNDFPLINEILNSKPATMEKCKYSRFHAKQLLNSVIDDVEHFSYLLISKYHAQFQHFRAHNILPIQRPDHFEMRVKLLVQEIDDPLFKIKLQRADKAYKKGVAKKHVYDMTYAAAGDILRNSIASVSFEETVKQIHHLLEYSNAALARIEKGYSCIATKYKFYNHLEELRKHSYWYEDIRYYNRL